MTSDEYLETEARNRLNLSKKGEVAFVIPEEILEKGFYRWKESSMKMREFLISRTGGYGRTFS